MSTYISGMSWRAMTCDILQLAFNSAYIAFVVDVYCVVHFTAFCVICTQKLYSDE